MGNIPKGLEHDEVATWNLNFGRLFVFLSRINLGPASTNVNQNIRPSSISENTCR